MSSSRAGTAAQIHWQTIGIYRVDVNHCWIGEVWFVPLDGELFDRF